MSQTHLYSYASAVESHDVPERVPWWRLRVPSGNLRALFPRFPRVITVESPSEGDSRALYTEIVEHLSIPRPCVSACRRFFGNLRAIFARFLALVFKPKGCLPLLADFWLLLQSTWSGRQLLVGPDSVYPMLSITKRRSGRLASLILEHSRYEPSYEFRSTPEPLQGIYSPCVAVIDLDDIPHHSYNVPLDLFGAACMDIFLLVLGSLIVHVFYLWEQEVSQLVVFWVSSGASLLVICSLAATLGDGDLTLVRRSNLPASGSVALLDHNFTVLLSGSGDAVEAIVESGFIRSDSKPDPSLSQRPGGTLIRNIINLLPESACVAMLVLFFLAFRSKSLLGHWSFFAGGVIVVISISFPYSFHDQANFVTRLCRAIPAALCMIFSVSQPSITRVLVSYSSCFSVFHLGLVYLTSYGLNVNYTIQTAKLLVALGQPRVRKWKFDTLANAATFQCLVICRGISRPVRSIDVAAFLDLLVPDQTPVWKTWKNRVADRILYDTDIDFAPKVPTFPDERQRQLKDLLDQAQSGYDTYQRFFDS